MKTEGEVTERNTPTPVISPRFRVRRDENGSYDLVIYTHRAPVPPNEPVGTPVLQRTEYSVTSRAAQELFDELVRELAKEGRAS